MDEAVLKELRRRCDLLIQNASPGTIDNGMSGSKVRFNMGLNLLGTNINPPSWWDEDYKKPCMDLETFHSPIYDSYIDELFNEAYSKVNSITTQ